MESMRQIEDEFDLLSRRVTQIEKLQAEAIQRRQSDISHIQDRRLDQLPITAQRHLAERVLPLTPEIMRDVFQSDRPHDRSCDALIARTERVIKSDRWGFVNRVVAFMYTSWGMMCLYLSLFIVHLCPSFRAQVGLRQPRSSTRPVAVASKQHRVPSRTHNTL
jgi:hypothetical protein